MYGAICPMCYSSIIDKPCVCKIFFLQRYI